MWNSEVKVNDFINDIRNETDIAIDIPENYYIQWINECQQLLYSAIIRGKKTINGVLNEFSAKTDYSNYNNLIYISPDKIAEKTRTTGDTVRFDDIYTIDFTDAKNMTTQLMRATPYNGRLFSNCYFPNDLPDENFTVVLSIDKNRTINPPYNSTVKIVYYIRPAMVTSSNLDTQYIMLPVEWLEMIRSYVRGQAYETANEDTIAAKWLNNYNALLESFKQWILSLEPKMGM